MSIPRSPVSTYGFRFSWRVEPHGTPGCGEFRLASRGSWHAQSRLERPSVHVVDRAAGSDSSEDTEDLDLKQVGEAEDATVEALVVQRAEGEAVVEIVGAVEVERADVGCLDPHRSTPDGAIETVERTCPIPAGKDASTQAALRRPTGSSVVRPTVGASTWSGSKPTAARTSGATAEENWASTICRANAWVREGSRRSASSMALVN